MKTWAEVSGKLGNITAATKSVAQEVFEAARNADHEIWFIWGWGPEPEHNSRTALDFMVHNEAAGDWVRDYIWNNRARLGLKHVIWWQHITSTVTRPGVWVQMEDRGDPTANHYDHVHMLRFDVDYRPAGASGGGKTNEQIAAEVWQGVWGNGDDRRSRLSRAGYDYNAIQALVNQGVGRSGTPRKSIDQLATEVIRGDWGNGDDRRRRLTGEGYDYAAVQAEVNRRV